MKPTTIAIALLLMAATLASLPTATAWTTATHTDTGGGHPCGQHGDPTSLSFDDAWCFTGGLLCVVFTGDCAAELLGCRIGHDPEYRPGHPLLHMENCPIASQQAIVYAHSGDEPPICPYVVPFAVCVAGALYCEVFTACEEEILGACVGYDPSRPEGPFYVKEGCDLAGADA